MLESKHTVHRIDFGKKLEFPFNRRGTIEEYVRIFGSKPFPDPLELPSECYHDQPGLRNQLKSASLQLLLQGMGYDEGPYTDSNGNLARFSADVLRDSNGAILDAIERIMDRTRPFDGSPAESMLPRIYGFGNDSMVFDPCMLVSDDFPTAGVIMGQKRSLSDEGHFAIIHPSEPYLLAAALLRRQGLMAYPGRAFTGSEDGDKFVPILGMFAGESDPALITLRLLRVHPDVQWLELWSDEAVLGSLHAMRAVSRANRLAVDSVSRFLDGKKDDLSAKLLATVSEDLFSCHSRFRLPDEQDNHLLPQTYEAIYAHLFQAASWKALQGGFRRSAKAPGLDFFLCSRGIEKAAPRLPIEPAHHEMFLARDESILDAYPRFRKIFLEAWSVGAHDAQEAITHVISLMNDRIQETLDDSHA
jgi:hypothetical protein